MKNKLAPLETFQTAAASLRMLSTAKSCPLAPAKTTGHADRDLINSRIDEYQSFEKLAQGTTSAVFRASRKSDQQDVAVKIMRTHDEELVMTALQEYDILKSIRHPYIIKAIDFFTFPRGIALVLEFFPGSSLKAAVQHAPSKQFPESTARAIFLKLIIAIDYLHTNSIIHRDVKPENVLVCPQLDDVRLIDFNVAGHLKDGALTVTGTVQYMPPEVLLGESPTAAGDVWAAGLSLYFMLCGKLPLEKGGSSRYEMGRQLSLESTLRLPPAVSKCTSTECKAALGCCLQIDPKTRALPNELLASQWLQ